MTFTWKLLTKYFPPGWPLPWTWKLSKIDFRRKSQNFYLQSCNSCGFCEINSDPFGANHVCLPIAVWLTIQITWFIFIAYEFKVFQVLIWLIWPIYGLSSIKILPGMHDEYAILSTKFEWITSVVSIFPVVGGACETNDGRRVIAISLVLLFAFWLKLIFNDFIRQTVSKNLTS